MYCQVLGIFYYHKYKVEYTIELRVIKIVLIRVIIKNIYFNMVLKSEIGQYFRIIYFLQMTHLLWDGWSILLHIIYYIVYKILCYITILFYCKKLLL